MLNVTDVHVEMIKSSSDESIVRVSNLAFEQEPIRLWIRTEGELAQDMSGWLPMLLPVAMRTGQTLRLHGVVDQHALAQAELAQRVLHSWFGTPDNSYTKRTLSRVQVSADDVSLSQSAEGSVVLFSGGVDSFHTCLRHESSHLLFIRGFDVPLDNQWLIEQTANRLSAAAHDMGRILIQAATNVREISDRYADWGYQYHGAGIAGVAIAHSPLWGDVRIASSFSPRQRAPWGTHPELDHLWSSSATHIVHAAPEWERAEKVAEISEWPVAMNHLRVCWRNLTQDYNCGRCEKCVRTMISLHSLGALERCSTLPHDLTPARIINAPILSDSDRYFARANVEALTAAGDDAIARVLVKAIRRGQAINRYRRARVRLAGRVTNTRRAMGQIFG